MLYCTGILKTGSRCVILYKQYKSLSAPKAPKKKMGFAMTKHAFTIAEARLSNSHGAVQYGIVIG